MFGAFGGSRGDLGSSFFLKNASYLSFFRLLGSILEHFLDKNHVIFSVLFCMCVCMSFFMIFDDFWIVFEMFLDNFFHYFVRS